MVVCWAILWKGSLRPPRQVFLPQGQVCRSKLAPGARAGHCKSSIMGGGGGVGGGGGLVEAREPEASHRPSLSCKGDPFVAAHHPAGLLNEHHTACDGSSSRARVPVAIEPAGATKARSTVR